MAEAHGAHIRSLAVWEASRDHDGESVRFYEGLGLLDIEVGAPRAPGVELSFNTILAPDTKHLKVPRQVRRPSLPTNPKQACEARDDASTATL